jgi:tetratricopeptide (TPR) repeat protein
MSAIPVQHHLMQHISGLNNLGVIDFDSGKLDTAQAYFSKAIGLLKGISGLSSHQFPPIGCCSASKTRILNTRRSFQREDYDEGMDVYGNALSFTSERGGDHERYENLLAITLLNQGNCYVRQSLERDAYSSFYESISLWQRRSLCTECEHAGLISALHNIGRIEYQNGLYNDALSTYTRALDVCGAPSIEDRLCALARAATLNCLSVVLFHLPQGDTEKALSLCHMSLKAYKLIQGPSAMTKEISTVMNNIGRIHFLRHEFKVAMSVYKEALPMRRKLLGNKSTDVAATVYNIAQTSHALLSYDQALAYYGEFLTIAKENLGENHRDIVAALKVSSTHQHTHSETHVASPTSSSPLVRIWPRSIKIWATE